MDESFKGRLLVATPGLLDPNFERTVVLLVEHGEDGALGVVLNRPGDLSVAEALPGWAPLTTEPRVVFLGGPVAVGSALCLARLRGDEPPIWHQVVGRVGVVDPAADPDDLALHVDAMRVFTGYAGWGDGQLEHEIDEGSWFIIDASEQDVLATDPDELWSDVLARQGGRYRIFAQYPPDPSLN